MKHELSELIRNLQLPVVTSTSFWGAVDWNVHISSCDSCEHGGGA